MKITVLGGSGFLGSHLCDLLTQQGHDVNIFDIKKSKYKQKNQKMYLGSILNSKQLSLAIKGSDFVYHFAALADMDFARTRPLESAEINIKGTINALNVSLRHKVKRFIFASSIYANTEEGGFYGSSKKAAESYVERFYDTFGLKYTILRFGSLYGTRSDETNGINVIINSGIRKKKLIYSGTRNAARNYIHVKDAVNLCTKVIKKKYENKYLIITGKKRIKVNKLMRIVASVLKIPKNKIKFLNGKYVGHYVNKPTLFTPRAGKKINIKNEQDIEKNLKYLISEIRKK